MLAHIHIGAGGALDIGVVHADELVIAGATHGNFDGGGAVTDGLCIGVGSMFGAHIAGASVSNKEFVGLMEQLMRGSVAANSFNFSAGVSNVGSVCSVVCGVSFAGLECEGGGNERSGTDEAAAAQVLRGFRGCDHRGGPFL